jgi:hypothetical protein
MAAGDGIVTLTKRDQHQGVSKLYNDVKCHEQQYANLLKYIDLSQLAWILLFQYLSGVGKGGNSNSLETSIC